MTTYYYCIRCTLHFVNIYCVPFFSLAVDDILCVLVVFHFHFYPTFINPLAIVVTCDIIIISHVIIIDVSSIIIILETSIFKETTDAV